MRKIIQCGFTLLTTFHTVVPYPNSRADAQKINYFTTKYYNISYMYYGMTHTYINFQNHGGIKEYKMEEFLFSEVN